MVWLTTGARPGGGPGHGPGETAWGCGVESVRPVIRPNNEPHNPMRLSPAKVASAQHMVLSGVAAARVGLRKPGPEAQTIRQ
jgi:hypothetical protein